VRREAGENLASEPIWVGFHAWMFGPPTFEFGPPGCDRGAALTACDRVLCGLGGPTVRVSHVTLPLHWCAARSTAAGASSVFHGWGFASPRARVKSALRDFGAWRTVVNVMVASPRFLDRSMALLGRWIVPCSGRRTGWGIASARAWRKTIGLLIPVTVVTLIAAGCSSSAPKAAPPSSSTAMPASDSTTSGTSPITTMPSKFATLYLNILGPADQASGTFFTALQKLPSTATGADAEKIAAPAADAIDLADRQLLEVSWPGDVANDIRRLVLVDTRLVADLRNVAKQNSVTSGGWKNQFEGDVAQVAAQVNVVVAKIQTPTSSK